SIQPQPHQLIEFPIMHPLARKPIFPPAPVPPVDTGSCKLNASFPLRIYIRSSTSTPVEIETQIVARAIKAKADDGQSYPCAMTDAGLVWENGQNAVCLNGYCEAEFTDILEGEAQESDRGDQGTLCLKARWHDGQPDGPVSITGIWNDTLIDYA